eukprot:TRINITY_DN14363_c0_g1_i2.p1 TRINITY_DN14363_c0_g1~~TRINITY_DN14363_c0_g1_i2.p1  ORF type:complete len:130 (+),score=0.09 TRINITY_DN14363_c0_g1_i2:278-667(+)
MQPTPQQIEDAIVCCIKYHQGVSTYSKLLYLLSQFSIPPNVNMCIKGVPLLYIASASDNVPAIDFLVTNGADLNCREPKANSTPLHGACYHGRISAVRALLQHGARAVYPYRHIWYIGVFLKILNTTDI